MVSYFAVVTYMIASSYQRSIMAATIVTKPRHRPGIYYNDNLPSAQGKSNTATNHLLQKSLQEIKENPLNNECKMWKV